MGWAGNEQLIHLPGKNTLLDLPQLKADPHGMFRFKEKKTGKKPESHERSQ